MADAAIASLPLGAAALVPAALGSTPAGGLGAASPNAGGVPLAPDASSPDGFAGMFAAIASASGTGTNQPGMPSAILRVMAGQPDGPFSRSEEASATGSLDDAAIDRGDDDNEGAADPLAAAIAQGVTAVLALAQPPAPALRATTLRTTTAATPPVPRMSVATQPLSAAGKSNAAPVSVGTPPDAVPVDAAVVAPVDAPKTESTLPPVSIPPEAGTPNAVSMGQAAVGGQVSAAPGLLAPSADPAIRSDATGAGASSIPSPIVSVGVAPASAQGAPRPVAEGATPDPAASTADAPMRPSIPARDTGRALAAAALPAIAPAMSAAPGSARSTASPDPQPAGAPQAAPATPLQGQAATPDVAAAPGPSAAADAPVTPAAAAGARLDSANDGTRRLVSFAPRSFGQAVHAKDDVTPTRTERGDARRTIEPTQLFTIAAQDRGAVAVTQPSTGAAIMPGDVAIQQHLSIARDGQWLDTLARDIAMSAGSGADLHFKLNPAHLGALTVQIAQGADGASIRMTADSNATRAILVEAQPRLIAEARAQGLKVSDAQVDLHHGHDGGGSAAMRQGDGSSAQNGQPRTPLPNHQPFSRSADISSNRAESEDGSDALYA